MRRVVGGLLLGALAIGLALTLAQGPFDGSSFAFGRYSSYEGTLYLRPAPMLVSEAGNFLLTVPGKFSASSAIAAFEGRPAALRGALVQNGCDRMLEMEPGSVRSVAREAQQQPRVESLGMVELAGEIADGKCYLGVMNPGRGKVHRDCAVRCLSGGAPPVMLVRDSAGSLHVVLLTGLGREILGYVAEPVRLRGELQRMGQQLVLRAEASSLRRE